MNIIIKSIARIASSKDFQRRILSFNFQVIYKYKDLNFSVLDFLL